MIKTVSAIAVAALLAGVLSASAHCSEYQLFTPRPLAGEVVQPEKGKGVLVERITIKPGDTLAKLSRQFSGRASYFPQILLFNDIKNPDLIIAGNELYVPVQKQIVSRQPKTAGDNAATLPAKEQPVTTKKKGAAKSIKAAATGKSSPAPTAVVKKSSGRTAGKEEQNVYQKAVTQYQQGDYRGALTAFTRFLDQYPQSQLAPDASLYKAECLLKLSGE
jgi:TolA-binding protein